MASEIKVNKITGKGATGGADAPLQFDGNVLTTATITNATISKINLSGTTPPSSPVAGDMYYDSADNIVRVWNGSIWERLTNTLVASGGTEDYYTSNGTTYKVHIFLTSGTTTFSTNAGSIDWLVVAGGGGGAGQMGAGGGAGGFRTGANYSIPAGTHTITVGAGGAGGPSPASNGNGVNGGNSSIGSLIVSTGGGGASGYNASSTPIDGNNGGSGGGGGSGDGVSGDGASATAITPVTGEVTTVQGYAGGDGTGPTGGAYTGGGGGGASEVGETSPNTTRGGAGGDGENNIMGMNDSDSDAFLTALSVGHDSGGTRYFSGGGTGTDYPSPSYQTASKGGGGSNSVGVANTGGGGSGRQGAAGYAGGSGIVIVRYAI
jgi:hypothetical protein